MIINYDEIFQELIDMIGHFKIAVAEAPHLMSEVVQFEIRLFDITDKASVISVTIAEFEVWTEDQKDALLEVKTVLQAFFALSNDIFEFRERLDRGEAP